MKGPAGANEARLDDVDALMLAVERDPTLSNTVASLAMFDSVVPPTALRARLELASRLVPRVRQRVVGDPGSLSPPRWEYDPDFDIDNHLDVVDCAGTNGMSDVLEQVARFVAQPLDRGRPLFRFHLVQLAEADQSALIMVAHHAITDGMGMLAMQLELFDFEANAPDPQDLPPAPEPEPIPKVERIAGELEHEVMRGLDALRDMATMVTRGASSASEVADRAVELLCSGLQAAMPVEPLSPCLTGRSSETWFDVITLPLAELKDAGRRADTRLNAVFVAGVARGLGLFHEELDSPVKLLRMGMPVNQRSAEADTAGGNFIAPLRFEVPLAAAEPLHLVQIVQALIEAQRSEPVLGLIGPAARLVNQLPGSLAGKAFGSVLRGSDFLTSNVAGSPAPMYLGPARMVAQFPFGPTSAAALNITLLSYLDNAHIGITIDTAATDEPERLSRCLRQGFDWIVS